MTNQSSIVSEVIPITVEEELKRSYLDYAMSVIVSRALPDVRDGLKPVHRRILYTMMEEGFDYDKPYRKCARVVGQVVSKYHPHGTDPVYGAMVRLAQDFAMRLPLIQGHGNFGSMDGDDAAAMRYTEARLAHLAHFLLEDYDKDTVNFQPNYDDTLEIPVVLPAGFPNLLVNGASGIAVGMATNIPSHNLGEVIDACCFLIDSPQASLEEVMQFIKAPDFPTGGIILGHHGIIEAYRSGKGSFIIRGKTHIESIKQKEAIIITEIPYQVNKSLMVQKIAELVNQKEIEGISDLRDESDRTGVRVVIELKKEACAEVILNRLYAMSPLQISFGINMLALHQDRPVQMGLLDVLSAFLQFRKEVVTRRTRFFLRKARDKAHILAGLVVAVSHIDEVIYLIKSSADTQEAFLRLRNKEWPIEGMLKEYLLRIQTEEQPLELSETGYRLSEEQTKAILALRLQRLTGMEREQLYGDLEKLLKDIDMYLHMLSTPQVILDLMKSEMQHIKTKFADARRTEVSYHESHQKDIEDLIPCEDMVVTVSVKGYIKRVPLNTYRRQKRGGRGRQAMTTREEDEVANVFVADTHTLLLCFTSYGQAYQLKVHELPLGTSQSKGKPLVSLFPLENGESLATLLPLPKSFEEEGWNIVFVTSKGNIRKNDVKQFVGIRSNGKIAIRLADGEKLIGVSLVKDNQDILLSSLHGKSIRFSSADVRQFTGRQSTGVKGMSLKASDEIVAMSILSSLHYSPEQIELYFQSRRKDEEKQDIENLQITEKADEALFQKMEEEEQFILSLSANGFGKRTSCYAYRRTHRGGQGVATMEVTEKTGFIVNALPVAAEDELLILSDKGQLMRCSVKDIRISARRTQGVRIFRLEKDEQIISVAVLSFDAESSEEEDLATEHESAE